MKKFNYTSVKNYNKLHLWLFPSAGPNANIKGMREKFWGKDCYILQCGKYIYKVPYSIFSRTL